MNQDFPNSPAPEILLPDAVAEAKQTLRLLATLEPPVGLTERVHRRIQERRNEGLPRRGWFVWRPLPRYQFAGAALIIAVLASGSWGLYQSRQKPTYAAPPHLSGPEDFGTSGAARVPQTLKPLLVPVAPKKKAVASGHRSAKKSSAPGASKVAERP